LAFKIGYAPRDDIYCNATDQLFLAELIMNILVDVLPYTLLIGAMVARYMMSAK
jgi:hypothetical protein